MMDPEPNMEQYRVRGAVGTGPYTLGIVKLLSCSYLESEEMTVGRENVASTQREDGGVSWNQTSILR